MPSRLRAVWWIPVVVGVVAGLMVLVSGPGTRLELWNFRLGLQLLRWGAYLGLAALVLVAVTAVVARPRGAAALLLAIAVASAAFAFLVPWQWQRRARGVPPIHDITTDLEDPPAFVAVLPLRAGASNPPEYAGPEVAAIQREAYPSLQPLMLAMPPAEALAAAEHAARGMGWEIVAIDPDAGRLEATDTTPWFGFKDDVVVRVRSTEGGTRVDVRSKSRVGRGDVGTNFRRVSEFLERLQQDTAAAP